MATTGAAGVLGGGGGVVAVGACPKRAAAHVVHPAIIATLQGPERNLMIWREV